MQTPIPTPHDRYFKGAMSNVEVAKDFFLAHLPPEISVSLDFTSLQLYSGNFIDEALQHNATDVLYQIQTTDAKPGLIYVLAEHQSTADRWMALRLLQYSLNIFAQYRAQHPEETLLPILIPLVFYNGSQPYSYSTHYVDLFADPALVRTLFLQGFQLIDLTQISDEALCQHQQASLMQYLMKHVWEREITQLLKQWLVTFLQQPFLQQTYLKMSLEYLFDQYNNQQLQSFLKEAATQLTDAAGETLMSMADQLRQEGREQGMLQGETTLLQRLLERKFGALSLSDLNKLQAATAEQVLSWGDRILDAQNLSDVFNQH